MQRSATCVASPSLARACSAGGSNAPGAYIVHKVDVTTGTEVDLFVNTFKELDVNAVGSVAVGIVPVVPPVPPQVASAKPNGVGIADDYNDVFYAFGHDVYSLYVAALHRLAGGRLAAHLMRAVAGLPHGTGNACSPSTRLCVCLLLCVVVHCRLWPRVCPRSPPWLGMFGVSRAASCL